MKGYISRFEKILITLITFSFSILFLVQFLDNNNVLDTIKVNEKDIPILYQESTNYIAEGQIDITLSDFSDIDILINGEVNKSFTENNENSYINFKLYDSDVVEIKNNLDEIVTVQIINISENITFPSFNDKYECAKGITYLFKVKIEKRS